MFFFLSKILDLAFSPLSWALASLIVALAVWRRRPMLARRATGLALAVLLVFSLEIVANGLIHALETPSTRTIREDVTYDAVLLLGGLVEERPAEDFGLPSYNEASERLLATYDLLRTGRARTTVISGGAGGEREGDRGAGALGPADRLGDRARPRDRGAEGAEHA